MSTDASVAEEPNPPSLLEELQSWWEVVSIAQYVSLFREAFNLPEIEIEELETGLIEDTTNGPSAWLEDLVVSLMRASMWTRVNKENWQSILRKLVARKCPADQETPFPDHKLFYQLELRAKVDIIYLLCLHRLDKNDITEIMKSMDADALRVQKLGVDDEGSAYWYFYGTRLYKEEPVKEEKSWDEEWTKQKRRSFRIKRKRRGRPKKLKNLNSDGESENEDDSKFMNVSEKSRWSVVCDTLEQWIAFAAKFQNSKSKNEKALFQVIQENFLPTLNQIYEEKEKKIQEKLKELLPVRERILTRRETRKLRGEPSPPPATNGYASSEEDQHSRPSLAEDRARRLEERRKRLDEAAAAAEFQAFRKPRHEDRYYEDSSDQGSSSRDADDYSNPSVPSSDQSLDLQSQMEKLISHIKIHKDAWPFVHPVSEEEAAGYYEIIQDPVDLSSIEKKLREGAYETVGDLDSDFSQMVSNCEIYNGENHPFSKMAQTLWTIFRKGVSNILDSFPPEQLSNEGSEENSNCSDQMYMPPHPHKHKKHKKGKKKKKPARGMEALEMLAQASELAVKNSNSDDLLNGSHGHHELTGSCDIPGLRISTTHSHPQSLIDKLSSPHDSPAENSSDELSTNSLDAGPAPMMCESVPFDSGNLAQLANFLEKNTVKGFNILSTSDVASVFNDGSFGVQEAGSSDPAKDVSTRQTSPEVRDQNLVSNGNSSNAKSQVEKQLQHESNRSGVNSNQAPISVGNTTKSLSSPVSFTTMPLFPTNEGTTYQTSGISHGQVPQNISGLPGGNFLSTIDASALGLSYTHNPQLASSSLVFSQNQSQVGMHQNHPVILHKPSPTYVVQSHFPSPQYEQQSSPARTFQTSPISNGNNAAVCKQQPSPFEQSMPQFSPTYQQQNSPNGQPTLQTSPTHQQQPSSVEQPLTNSSSFQQEPSPVEQQVLQTSPTYQQKLSPVELPSTNSSPQQQQPSPVEQVLHTSPTYQQQLSPVQLPSTKTSPSNEKQPSPVGQPLLQTSSTYQQQPSPVEFEQLALQSRFLHQLQSSPVDQVFQQLSPGYQQQPSPVQQPFLNFRPVYLPQPRSENHQGPSPNQHFAQQSSSCEQQSFSNQQLQESQVQPSSTHPSSHPSSQQLNSVSMTLTSDQSNQLDVPSQGSADATNQLKENFSVSQGQSSPDQVSLCGSSFRSQLSPSQKSQRLKSSHGQPSPGQQSPPSSASDLQLGSDQPKLQNSNSQQLLDLGQEPKQNGTSQPQVISSGLPAPQLSPGHQHLQNSLSQHHFRLPVQQQGLPQQASTGPPALQNSAYQHQQSPGQFANQNSAFQQLHTSGQQQNLSSQHLPNTSVQTQKPNTSNHLQQPDVVFLPQQNYLNGQFPVSGQKTDGQQTFQLHPSMLSNQWTPYHYFPPNHQNGFSQVPGTSSQSNGSMLPLQVPTSYPQSSQNTHQNGFCQVPSTSSQSNGSMLSLQVPTSYPQSSQNTHQNGFCQVPSTSSQSNGSMLPLQVPTSYPQSSQNTHQHGFSQVPSTSSLSNGTMPLQIPTAYPQSSQNTQPRILLDKDGQSMRVHVPPPGGHIMVVTEASGPAVTYHVYTQSKMDNSIAEEHFNFVPGKGASRIRHSKRKNSENISSEQNEVPGASSPQNTSPPPPKTSSEPPKSQSPRTQPSVVAPSRVHSSVATSRPQPSVVAPSKVQTVVAPPQKRPCYAPSASTAHQQPSIVRTSLPITSSNFVPVQASPDRTKPLIIRKPPVQQTVSSTSASTTLVSNSYRSGGESSASAKRAAYTTYQSLAGPRTVPTTQLSYNPAVPSSQNLVPASPGQSNLCLPGSGAVIQKIIIPAGQPIQLQNGQQLIFASSPQGAINRVFNANQGQIRQVSIDASKMVPQGMSGAPVIHVSKEQLERIQLALSQNASQGFAQAAANSQILNVPTYILSNQNQGQASVVQQLQMTPTGQMNGQGNG